MTTLADTIQRTDSENKCETAGIPMGWSPNSRAALLQPVG